MNGRNVSIINVLFIATIWRKGDGNDDYNDDDRDVIVIVTNIVIIVISKTPAVDADAADDVDDDDDAATPNASGSRFASRLLPLIASSSSILFASARASGQVQ